MSKKPLVSLGMPTYNGERYLRQSLDSLLAQDCTDFELLISDNGSTDKTQEICMEYAAKDDRIRYFRNERNMGTVFNFKKVLDVSVGQYFMWAADHDLWDPSYVSKCVSVFERDPQVVLVYSRSLFIDQEGKTIKATLDELDTTGMLPLDRYIHIVEKLHWCDLIYGVIRRDALSRVSFKNIIGLDNLQLAQLALMGTFKQIPEALFSMRKNREAKEVEEVIERVLVSSDPQNLGTKTRRSSEYLYRELRAAHIKSLIFAPIRLSDKFVAITATRRIFKYKFGVHSRVFSFIRKIKSRVIKLKGES